MLELIDVPFLWAIVAFALVIWLAPLRIATPALTTAWLLLLVAAFTYGPSLELIGTAATVAVIAGVRATGIASDWLAEFARHLQEQRRRREQQQEQTQTVEDQGPAPAPVADDGMNEDTLVYSIPETGNHQPMPIEELLEDGQEYGFDTDTETVHLEQG